MNQANPILPQRLQSSLTRGYYDIVYFAEVLLGMPLHEGQKRYLRNATAKINLLDSANRWGKSVLMAVLHIHGNFYKLGIGRGNSEAWYRANYMTINLGPHSDATEPVFRAIKAILHSAFPIPQEGGGLKNNECLIGWFLDEDHCRNSVPYLITYQQNCSTLFRSLGEDKGTSIQGKHFGLATYDEGGRSHHLEYEIDSNIMPRLADLNGRLHIPSTPDMTSASILHHYELFEKGLNSEPGYYSQEGSIRENIFLLRNNPTYIEDETKRLAGNPILDQVLYGKFVFAGDNIFPGPDILEAKRDELIPGVPFKPGHKYIIGIDTAMGEDEMVFTVMDETEENKEISRQVGCKGNSKSPQIHMADFEGLVRSYAAPIPGTERKSLSNIKIILETWNGESARFYQDMPYDLQAITKCFGSWQPMGVKVVGRNPRNVKKAELLLALRKLLAQRTLTIPNESTLIKQLSIYREDDKNIPTDRVMSLALACWLATDGAPKHNNQAIDVDW